jgi:glycosyltransferase involved in cell wall biosynthesis
MDKGTPIQFDQYQRYGIAARAIEALRKNGEQLNILEVGANTHKLLGRLLPNDRIIYLDREIPLEIQQQSDIIVGDATELTLPDASFDVVVALDVFEHIPTERREAFLSHTCRVARLLTIIGAPFDFPFVIQAEREAIAYWDSLFAHPYRWLAEHAENGLPNLDWTTQTVASMGYHQHTLRHGDVKLWVDFIKGHFAAVYVGSLQPVLSTLYQYYQDHLFEQDFSPSESYRQFVFCSRDSTIIQALKNRFDELKMSPSTNVSSDFPVQILKLIPAVAEELVTKLSERDKQLSERDKQLSERDIQIATLLNSTSWRVTRPLRIVSHQIKRLRRVVKLILLVIKHSGGLKNTFKKALQLYRLEGFAGIKRGLRRAAPHARNDYAEWILRYDTLTDESRATMRAHIDTLTYKPLISVVMPVYNAKPEWLIEAIESVRGQIYPSWELCIADDASTDKAIRPILESYAREDSRIKVVLREINGHISAASNSALDLATGEWVALLDHDDLLTEQALFWMADAVNQNPDIRLIYSDEDKTDETGRRFDPYFKCDWNVDLFHSHNLITHLGLYRADLLNAIGGFKVGLEGAQDYDLALRCIEHIETKQIHHIPRVLYHWRMHDQSTAQSANHKPYAMLAGERALNEHFQRQKINAQAEHTDYGYRVRYALPDILPMVSLVIPTRNGLQLLQQCVGSILKKTSYPNYEILIIDNGSDDPATLQYLDELQAEARVRVVRDDRPFNYSALNNAAVKLTRGEVVGLLNNDLEVISPDWLSEMVSIALQPGVGAVGARLWYPNNKLQHGGVILGLGGVAGHSHKLLPRNQNGYAYRASIIQTFSAVTAACLVIRKEIYEKVGGLNETYLQVAFNDVDFCLRVREAGYRNVWTPYAELYHHESATRGFEDTPEKQARFAKEVQYMKQRWGDGLLNDPAYSPNLTLDQEDFSLAWPPRVKDGLNNSLKSSEDLKW